MGFISHLQAALRLMQLPKSRRRLTFYSEGKNYWPNLSGLITETLSRSDISICYLSSGDDDPGTHYQHPNYQAFVIGSGHVRNWLFENLDTDYLVLTMPDLHQFQVKKSRHNVHYIYVQHALMSLHMTYRHGAFDHYDTIFCAGPHHKKEILALEHKYHLPKKTLVEHGYSRLDTLVAAAQAQPENPIKNSASGQHFLLAPSWGNQGMIEAGLAAGLIEQLLSLGHQVTLRPHPQTIKLNQKRINPILKKHRQNPLFNYDDSLVSQQSLHDSQIMISDWSGAALEYALGLNKPVLFVDLPKKINNPHYLEINLQPFEAAIRNRIGKVMTTVDGQVQLPSALNALQPVSHPEEYVYNLGNSDRVGADYLISLLA